MMMMKQEGASRQNRCSYDPPTQLRFSGTTLLLLLRNYPLWAWKVVRILLLILAAAAMWDSSSFSSCAVSRFPVAAAANFYPHPHHQYPIRSTRRHDDNDSINGGIIHKRLIQSLQYHSEFANFDFDSILVKNLNENDIKMDPSPFQLLGSVAGGAAAIGEDHQQTIRTALRNNHHNHTSPKLLSDTKRRKIPMTLTQAKIIHQHAMRATHSVMRSHGHLPRTQNDKDATIMSPLPLDCRTTTPKTLVSPIDYGADPTGQEDSTPAFTQLMKDLLQSTTTPPHRRPMAANITNLGGITLDLQGGMYLISQPIVIPPYYGNLHIINGSFQASSEFPPDRWLMEIGSNDDKGLFCHPIIPGTNKTDQQQSCNEFIDVTNVLLDANFRAAGGIRIAQVMGTSLTEVFVTGFLSSGISIVKGHEVMISNAWLAECYWSNAQLCRSDRHSQSIGILVDGMDHYITNTIVFDFAKVGISIRQPANLLVGVHTWNGGGRGIELQSHTIRLLGCYLDFETLDIWNPHDILVESTFFYFGHVVLHADEAGSEANIDGLTMRSNHYNTNQSVVLDGTFDRVQSVSIQEEVDWVKTTKAQRSLTLHNATEWTFDFSEPLLFPNIPIDSVGYSVVLLTGNHQPVSHVAYQPKGTLNVTIAISEPVDATVYVTVEQGGNHFR